MELSDDLISHFHRRGFFLVPNLLGTEKVGKVDLLQRKITHEWENTNWPEGFNRLACQFFMVGELLLEIVEQPHLLEIARRLLGCTEVHIGACGIGDASLIISEDGRSERQVHWHSDGDATVKQVSFRTALDRHDPTNAPLRVLPGSHNRPKGVVLEELRQLELATGKHNVTPKLLFETHPEELVLVLDPAWTLVWTPSCWHATGVKTAEGPRRAMAWNYFPPGGRTRDLEALKMFFGDRWKRWSKERKGLWGIV